MSEGPFNTEGPGSDPYPDPPVTPSEVGTTDWRTVDDGDDDDDRDDSDD
jgi:hypothetical protein